MTKRLVACTLLAGFTLGLAPACASNPSGEEPATADSDYTEDRSVVSGKAPTYCAAVRGNGHYIVTHFASLARLVETYGVIRGMAGGSSGSLTQFLYESILLNPQVRLCNKADGGTRECTRQEGSARVALMLKSLQGYGEAVAASEEVVGIADLARLVSKLKKEVDTQGVGGLLTDASTPADATEAAKRLREILAIPEFANIVNPEIPALLASPSRAGFAAKDVHQSIVTLGAFSVDDNRLFFRPGLLNWDALATLFGRVGDFYAGYRAFEADKLNSWLTDCQAAALGKDWAQVSALPTDGGTCGERFALLVSSYRTAVREAPAGGPQVRSRLDDRIDTPTPLAKLIATSVLEGDAAEKYNTARKEYLEGKYPTGDIGFAPDFSDIKFGYWGRKEHLTKVASNPKGYTDAKTAKFTALPSASWREVLRTSPAEPGLSRFVELADGRISAGGWSDLAPVLALRNMGCEHVLYVTREGDESGFAVKIAKKLGLTESDWKTLYDLGSDSAYTKSLEQADGVWCTNWNSFGDLAQKEMALESYNATLETNGGLPARSMRKYSNISESTGKAGCTPLVAGTATYPQ
jgi:hypothetical protein